MTTTERTKYSKAVSTLRDWKTTAVIRPYYRLTHTGADKLVKRIVDNSQDIGAIWYTLEEDSHSDLNHLHLLIDAQVTKESLSNDARLNARFANYCQPIESPEAITGYVNKHLDKRNSHHNIFTKLYLDKHQTYKTLTVTPQ